MSPSRAEGFSARLGSARDLFASARIYFLQLENQKIAIFCCTEKKKLELKKLHTKKLFSAMFYEKKGTFDFKNPRFKNSYHKNSSNSTNLY